ncbi:MAG: porin [Lautropia sp.]
MKRSLNVARLLAAVTAGCALSTMAPAAAQTNVTLYGLLDAYVGHYSDTVPARISDTVVGSGGLTTSFFGIRGSEDLGSGLRGVFAMESFLRLDTGTPGRFGADPFWSRTANVGLAGGFGTFVLGRNTTPFFLATVFHNPLGDSFVVGPAITHVFRGNVLGDTGMSNSLRYTSPTFGGLRADVLYSLGNEVGSGPDKGTGEAIDSALFYGGGPFSAALGYRSIDLSANGDGHDQKSFIVGASYALSFAKLQAQYVNSKDTFDVLPEFKRRTFQIGASVPIGAGAVLLSYADTKLTDTSATTPNKRKTWAVGYDYTLSKRADLYAVYYGDELTEPQGNKQKYAVLGLRHRF